jgi:mannosyl-oligosaccharide alpha-1,2-mannosidase
MKSITGILENLVFLSKTRNLIYVTDTFVTASGLKPTRKLEHLSCFFPGLLALGAETLPESIMSTQQRELHRWAAEGLAHTCWVMYADQPSGLGPEIVIFHDWGTNDTPVWIHQTETWKQERWIGHVQKWEEDGRVGGKPPGVGNAGLPLKSEEGVKKDYVIQVSSYLLRPEVRTNIYMLADIWEFSIICRRWNLCLCYIVQPKILNGGSAAGRYGRPLNQRHARRAGMVASSV